MLSVVSNCGGDDSTIIISMDESQTSVMVFRVFIAKISQVTLAACTKWLSNLLQFSKYVLQGAAQNSSNSSEIVGKKTRTGLPLCRRPIITVKLYTEVEFARRWADDWTRSAFTSVS